MKIYITEKAQNRIFSESMMMDKERGKNARAFRVALKNAVNNGSYEIDDDTIYIEGYSYTYGKKFAETADGEPIELHYTYDTVMRILEPVFADKEYGDETEYELEF